MSTTQPDPTPDPELPPSQSAPEEPAPAVAPQTYAPPVAPPADKGMAQLILGLGIGAIVLSLFTGFGFVLGIIALAMAPGVKRNIVAAGGPQDALGMVKAGVICSWISIGLAVLSVLAIFFLFGLFFFAGV